MFFVPSALSSMTHIASKGCQTLLNNLNLAVPRLNRNFKEWKLGTPGSLLTLIRSLVTLISW